MGQIFAAASWTKFQGLFQGSFQKSENLVQIPKNFIDGTKLR